MTWGRLWQRKFTEAEARALDDANDYLYDGEAEVKSDPFDVIVDEIQQMNQRKRGDYAAVGSPWQNFIDSSYQVGQPAGLSAEVLIATKQSRLRQLLFADREPNNEAVRDSLLDRAVYSIIALAMYDEGLYR